MLHALLATFEHVKVHLTASPETAALHTHMDNHTKSYSGAHISDRISSLGGVSPSENGGETVTSISSSLDAL